MGYWEEKAKFWEKEAQKSTAWAAEAQSFADQYKQWAADEAAHKEASE